MPIEPIESITVFGFTLSTVALFGILATAACVAVFVWAIRAAMRGPQRNNVSPLAEIRNIARDFKEMNRKDEELAGLSRSSGVPLDLLVAFKRGRRWRGIDAEVLEPDDKGARYEVRGVELADQDSPGFKKPERVVYRADGTVLAEKRR
jgi:hypothetical protein